MPQTLTNMYQEMEEHAVELLILNCGKNRNDATEICKNHFYADFTSNFDLYKHVSPRKAAQGYVETYIDEWC